MDTADLEAWLQGGRETPEFEAKGPMAWDPGRLAKDILAMSNLPDGGFIVIGIEDVTFGRVGVTDAISATFDEQIMRDQMAKYADPHVDFAVEAVHDAHGMQFVVIHVASFQEVPVVCRVDSAETVAGAVYYRSSRRRPESVPINNSYEMRDLLTVAAVRLAQRFDRLGLRIESLTDAVRDRLDRELGDL